MRHVRTLVLGNSVSGQKSGYVQQLAEQQPELGLGHSAHVCIGGVGTIGILALAGDLLRDLRADLVLVETSVMDAAGGTLFRDIPWAVHHLITRLAEVSPNIAVLHLPRFDMPATDVDAVVTAHNLIAKALGVRVIDAREVISHALTTDGIHLSVEGSQLLARFLAPRVSAMLDDPTTVVLQEDDVDNALYLPVRAHAWSAPDGEETRFRATLPTLRVPLPHTATVTLDGAMALTALCIAGPSSGVVEMRSPQGSALLQLWDPWCEFRRIQVLHVPHHVRSTGWLSMAPSMDEEAEFDAVCKPAARAHRGSALELVGVMARRVDAQ